MDTIAGGKKEKIDYDGLLEQCLLTSSPYLTRRSGFWISFAANPFRLIAIRLRGTKRTSFATDMPSSLKNGRRFEENTTEDANVSEQLNGLLRKQQPLTASLARSKVGGLHDLLG